MYIIDQIKVAAGLSADDEYRYLKKSIIKQIGCPADTKIEFEILKKSIDARKRPDIFYVFSVLIKNDVRKFKSKKRTNIRKAELKKYIFPYSIENAGRITDKDDKKRPVIAGFGPAGIFAALLLSRAGFRPIVLERGADADNRKKDVEEFWKTGRLNPESNVQFGEGGAGTFSDGKLNTGNTDKHGLSRFILEQLYIHGAPENILYENKPHIGTDVLCKVVKSIREEIILHGGEVRFGHKLISPILSKSGNLLGYIYEANGQSYESQCENLCIATGHSARDTFINLYNKNIPMSAKAFAVGLRIEHPQELIDCAMYGDIDTRKKLGLPAADYKLVYNTASGRGVYSFCMCPGGYVVDSSSEQGHVAVNGMSYNKCDGRNANSAIVAAVSPSDFGENILDGMYFQRDLEARAYSLAAGSVPIQILGDFLKGKNGGNFGEVIPAIKGKYEYCNLKSILPEYISNAIIEAIPVFGKKLKGFDREDAVLSGVETRTSSPIRILRDSNFMSETEGIFPCGEGAGYAGGIMSAAADGIRVAEAIAARLCD